MIVLWLSPQIQPEMLNQEPQFPKPHGTCEACPLVSDCRSPDRAWLYPFMSVSASSTDLVAAVPTPGQNPLQYSPASLCIVPCLHSPSLPGESQRLLPLWTPFPSSFPALWALHLLLLPLSWVVPSALFLVWSSQRRVFVLGVSITRGVVFKTQVPPQQEQQQTQMPTPSPEPQAQPTE